MGDYYEMIMLKVTCRFVTAFADGMEAVRAIADATTTVESRC